MTVKYSGAGGISDSKGVSKREFHYLRRESRQDSGASVNFKEETYSNEFSSLKTKPRKTRAGRTFVLDV